MTLEARLRTHDFTFPLTRRNQGQGGQLHVVLLTPNSLEDGSRQETISRLRRFASLTGGRDIAIALLQSESEPVARHSREGSLHGLLALQTLYAPTQIHYQR